MSVVITLVHGTFGRLPGRDAGWTREVSLLRQRLGTGLGADAVFVPFRWSGMNWPAARYRAATRLRDHFGRIARQYPGCRHYLVAHSHGGNVALYALRDAERANDPGLPCGVVCLSTPFIAAQPRPVTLFRFVATYAVLLVTMFAVVANLMGWLLAPWIAAAHSSNAGLDVLFLNEIWVEFLLCAVLAWYATKGLVALARERRERIAVEDIRTSVRIYRSIGDEASAVLATSSFLSWLATLAWSLASALTTLVAGMFAILLLWPGLVLLLGLLAAERLLGRRGLWHGVARAVRSQHFWIVIAALGTFGAFALWGFFLAGTPLGKAEMDYAMFIAALVFAVISFSALSGLGYGITAPFLEVTAEATPVGSWEVHLFAARTWGAKPVLSTRAAIRAASAAKLAHSAAYVHESVLGAIAGWIRERENPGAGSPQANPSRKSIREGPAGGSRRPGPRS